MPPQSISLHKLQRIAYRRGTRSLETASQLCEQCSKIRLRLDENLPANDAVVFLGPLKRIKQRDHCGLCQLVVQALPSADHVSNDDTEYTLNPRYGSGESYALVCGNTLPPVIKAWIYIDCPPGILSEFSTRLTRLHTVNPKQLKSLATNTRKLNHQTVHSWLHECETQHGEQCNKSVSLSSGRATKDLLLIDVVDGRLVEGDQDSRYIALSYVWGGWGGFQVSKVSYTNFPSFQKHGSLRSSHIQLPSVLRDAMELTLSVGERYLWCDAICIFQDSRWQKEEQIAQMDIIYSHALFTIVALSGKHGDEPLPGVREGTRESSFLVEELGGDLRLVLRAPDVNILTTNSLYDSRAWTFQERLLSRRCLFFTERQVFLQCASRVFREDENFFGQAESSSVRPAAGLLSMLAETSPLCVYFHLVHDYTNRDLTDSRDILFAFEGIVKALEPSLESNFLEGLPVHQLNDALLWTPQSRIRSRSISPESTILMGLSLRSPDSTSINFTSRSECARFPTWSWAHWTGQVCYKWPQGADYCSYRLEPLIKSFALAPKSDWDLPARSRSSPFHGASLGNHQSQSHGDDVEPLSSCFLRHFCLYSLQLVLIMYKHSLEVSYKHSLEVSNRSGQHNQDELLMLDSPQWELVGTPFARMPVLHELDALEKLLKLKSFPHFNFWPFNCINNAPTVQTSFQNYTHDPGARGPTRLPSWPFSRIPTRRDLDTHLQNMRIYIDATELGFWAPYTIRFYPSSLNGGQLYRNTFSMSSMYTTHDGLSQCDVATLELRSDDGVSPGQEKQPATLLRGSKSVAIGIVLEEEEDLIGRVGVRHCLLVPLSDCWEGEEHRWRNYMIVAFSSREMCGPCQRLGIARLAPSSLAGMEKASDVTYICAQ